jgi:hypothetical protein
MIETSRRFPSGGGREFWKLAAAAPFSSDRELESCKKSPFEMAITRLSDFHFCRHEKIHDMRQVGEVFGLKNCLEGLRMIPLNFSV